MVVKTIERDGFTATICHDQDAESPRDWDNASLFSFHHRRYRLPEEIGINSRDYGSWREMEAAIAKLHKGALILPVFMLDHSGITLRVGRDFTEYEGWDSGQVGFVVVTRERGRREWGRKWKAKAEKCAIGELETFNMFLSGDVYCIDVASAEGETADSCCGFFGFDSADEEAESMLTRAIDGAKAHAKEETPTKA